MPSISSNYSTTVLPRKRPLTVQHASSEEIHIRPKKTSKRHAAAAPRIPLLPSRSSQEKKTEMLHGIEPWGNYFLSANPKSVRHSGLGFFDALGDEFLIEYLKNYLTPQDISKLKACSKVWLVYASLEEVWRHHVIKDFGGDFDFTDSWQLTYINRHMHHNRQPYTTLFSQSIECPNLYSDVLFSSYYHASLSMSLSPWVKSGIDNIPRLHSPSHEEFIETCLKPNRPAIVTGVASQWPAMQKWTDEYLIQACGDTVFRAEAVDLTFKRYVEYAKQAREESPLYLFDKHFVQRTNLMNDIDIPSYLSSTTNDLFHLLGKERPDNQWIIIGPTRSGSTFHVDPNATNAYNAVIRGAKHWILLPPGCPPPGVFPSEDGSEVTAPRTLMEWFVNYYDQLKEWKKQGVEVMEGICREGEILFVPSGWWHCVQNIPTSLERDDEPDINIAFTANFVTPYNLPQVLRMLRDKPCQISGLETCSDDWVSDQEEQSREDDGGKLTRYNMFARFVDVLQTAVDKNQLDERVDKELIQQVLHDVKNEVAVSCVEKKSLWDTITEMKNVERKGVDESQDETAGCNNAGNGGLFSFSFGLVDE